MDESTSQTVYFFAATGVFFWVIFAVWLIAFFGFLVNDSGFGATASIIAFAAVLQILGGHDIIGYIASHPKELSCYTLLYMAAGTICGVVKWWLYVKQQRWEYDAAKANWLTSKGEKNINVIPDALKAEWTKYAYQRYGYDFGQAPSASRNKAMITRWMFFWWATVILSIAHDFVKSIFNAIYEYLSGTMQRISDSIFADTKSDFKDEGS